MKIPRGGFIFPRNGKENGADENKTFELKGFGGTIQTFGLEIPLNPQSPEDFAEKMQESEAELMERINGTVSRRNFYNSTDAKNRKREANQ